MERFKRFCVVWFISTALIAFAADGDVAMGLIIGIFFALFSLTYDTKEEKKRKAEAKKERERAYQREQEERKRQEESRKRAALMQEQARKAPGCHSMDNVDILSFRSANNLLTVGNNFIEMRIRNRNPYDIIVSICYKYNDSEGWDRRVISYQIPGNQIKTIHASGDAWRRAKDVTIVQVH